MARMTTTTAERKPRRRWLQFSLRGLSILILLIAMGLGWARHGGNLVRVGDANDVLTGTELERHEKISKIRFTRKKDVKISSVGGSMFFVKVFYEIAKARKCDYFVILEEWTDEDGNQVYTGGFTNKKDADIKQEFGERFSYKDESGQDRKLVSVAQFALLFEKK